MEKEFLILPVYRLSEDNYYSQRENYVDSQLYNFSDEDDNVARKQFHKAHPDIKLQFKCRLDGAYGGAWDFNEIIGHIKLHFVGNQIRGEYWAVDAKKIVKTRKKVFEYKTHKLAPEMSVGKLMDDSAIFAVVNQYIENCKKELNNRHIDDTQLKIVGPFINWRSLMNSYSII
ncbi:hypothetical protein [Aliivibrio logei]|uniref:hypothetical protein n=1 Tax=Aliivibrio logei TaxID=688 RepID=UPI0035C93A4C